MGKSGSLPRKRIVLLGAACLLGLALLLLLAKARVPPPARNSEAAAAEVRHRFVPSRGLRLHVADLGADGDPAKPLVLILAGFADYWGSFAPLMRALSADYRVAVLGLLGHDRSDAPEARALYDWDLLVRDVAATIHHFGAADAVLIGHDLGAYIAWIVAETEPSLVRALVSLAMPHPAVFARSFAEDPQQRQASAYLAHYSGADSHVKLSLADFSLPKVDGEVAGAYRAAMARSRPRAMLNYYRSLLPAPPYQPVYPLSTVAAPTLVILGAKDGAVLPLNVEAQARFVSGPLKTVVLPGVAHDPHRENFAVVERAVHDWLADHASRQIAPSTRTFEIDVSTVERQLPLGYRAKLFDQDGSGRADLVAIGADVRLYEVSKRSVARLDGAHPGLIDLLPWAASEPPTLFVAAGFDPRRLDAPGELFALRPKKAESQAPWDFEAVTSLPALHRLVELRLEETRLLVAAPIVGPLAGDDPAAAGSVALTLIRPGPLPAAAWERLTLATDLHLVHGILAVDFDGSGRDALLTASRDGIDLLQVNGSWPELSLKRQHLADGAPPTLGGKGSGEIALGRHAGGRRFLAAIEPWHGADVVVYEEPEAGGAWVRRVILSRPGGSGHGLATIDLDGGGGDAVVGCFFGAGRGIVALSEDPHRSGPWRARDLDAAIDCMGITSLDDPIRPGFVAVGEATQDVKVYRVRR